jgi:hypothetical protein
MTILIALHRRGVSAIFSDTAVSRRGANGRPEVCQEWAMKSGVLFPGCIYGVSGSQEGAKRFFDSVVPVIERTQGVENRWTQLQTLALRANTSPEHHFTMVLATRHERGSNIYFFDSNQDALGIQRATDDLYLDGSGAPLLEEQASALAEVVLGDVRLAAMHGTIPHAGNDLFAYLLLLSLRQRAIGEDKILFPRALINDEIHFIAQDQDHEWRQQPSMLIVGSVAHSDLINLEVRRTAFQNDTLIRWDWTAGADARWQCMLPAHIDEAARPDAERLRLSNEAIAKEKNGAPYYFLGAGVPLPGEHSAPIDIFFDVFDGEHYFGDTEGYISQTILNFIGEQSSGRPLPRLGNNGVVTLQQADYRRWEKKQRS